MIGFRDETEEEARRTIDFALESKLHTASFFILTPFPNTVCTRRLWRRATTWKPCIRITER